MKKAFTLMLFTLLALTTGRAHKSVAWVRPTIEYGTGNGDGYFNPALDITRVELTDTETVVHMTISLRPEYGIKFTRSAFLQTGDRRYALRTADGLELDKMASTHRDGTLDAVFHFEPIPQKTEVFDFIDGDGAEGSKIKGVRPVEGRWNQLFPSYWRNDATGDWEIAILDDCVLYGCKFWDYKQRSVDTRKGTAEFVLTSGDEEMRVVVGKNKRGRRTIQIGGQAVACSMITGRFMPDYPQPDNRTGFTDSGYHTDTVTLIGWLKDMPEEYKSYKSFDINYKDIFTDQQATAYAKLDEHGRFAIKIPMVNSSECFCDWQRCFVRMPFEVGKTYFMLYDFKEGRRFFMGDDCRLQNELFRFPLDWESVAMEHGNDPDKFITASDNLIRTQYTYIDSLCAANPSLSTRFKTYRKDNTLWQQASFVGQARFKMPDYRLTENMRRYATEEFWKKVSDPLTLHRETSAFLIDYISDKTRDQQPVVFNVLDYLKESDTNDEELILFRSWFDSINSHTEAARTIEEKERVAKEYQDAHVDLYRQVTEIMNGPKMKKIINDQLFINEMKKKVCQLDSLKALPTVRDIYLTSLAHEEIDRSRTSLDKEVMDTLRSMVQWQESIARIEKANAHYLAIENRDFDKLVLKSSDPLAGISEGEELLKKILEPLKGKFVLLDIWGTWCGPCKQALSHSTEEYTRLSKFDIAYLYLANNSSEESWTNVIKEYNVSGENVVHYNLPTEQQQAIERYLNVPAYPTYKLFDREGNLLDLKVDPRDLNGLYDLLDKLSAQ